MIKLITTFYVTHCQKLQARFKQGLNSEQLLLSKIVRTGEKGFEYDFA